MKADVDPSTLSSNKTLCYLSPAHAFPSGIPTATLRVRQRGCSIPAFMFDGGQKRFHTSPLQSRYCSSPPPLHQSSATPFLIHLASDLRGHTTASQSAPNAPAWLSGRACH